MLYLLYLRNGFIKKVPLSKKNTSLGRSSSNDLQLDEVFVSKEHAKIVMKQDSIEIFDLNSTNGVFSKKGKIRNEIINLNQYFRIGHIKFYLKIVGWVIHALLIYTELLLLNLMFRRNR